MMELKGAFVTRWQEEEHNSRRMANGSERERVMLFLEAMKYEIAKVIFAEVTTSGSAAQDREAASRH